MIRKFHEAKIDGHKTVVLWGSGSPRREFLFVDDLAKAVAFSIENKLSENLYNVGSGDDIEMKELALLVQRIVNHKGKILWDVSKPDGTPRKLMDVSKLNKLGWRQTVGLEEGIKKTYDWFLQNISTIKETTISNLMQ
jgi:GDP-L-fucose synthase